MFHYVVAVLSLIVAIGAKDISRSKRQLQSYYICGNGYSNGYISTNGCGNYNNGCGTNCGGGGSSGIIIPNSFYSPTINCQMPCSNVNCNQFSGQYINGQYIATVVGSNQYNPCASTCCSGLNNNNWNSGPIGWGNSVVVSGNNGFYNPYSTNTDTIYLNGINGFGNNGYNNNQFPYNIDTYPITQSSPVVISANVQRSPMSAFTGTSSNGVLLCGGTEPSGGSCAVNGQCPMGHLCMAGNVCCRCAVGASSGMCPSGNDSECPTGYACSSTLSCCPSQFTPSLTLTMCVNGSCMDGYECGKGNLCYPKKK